jgi:hypothetical protein
MEFDNAVKLNIYETIVQTTCVPTSAQVADDLGCPAGEVEEAFRRLAARRLLVLERGTASRIRMAPPFSGVETPFLARAGGKSYFANCIWDALGVPAALHLDARIEAFDGLMGEPLELEIAGGRPTPNPFTVHFAVPAAHWWDDILYT